MAANKPQMKAGKASDIQTTKKVPDHDFIHDVEHDMIFRALDKFVEDTFGTRGDVVAIANYKGKVRIYGKATVKK